MGTEEPLFSAKLCIGALTSAHGNCLCGFVLHERKLRLERSRDFSKVTQLRVGARADWRRCSPLSKLGADNLC